MKSLLSLILVFCFSFVALSQSDSLLKNIPYKSNNIYIGIETGSFQNNITVLGDAGFSSGIEPDLSLGFNLGYQFDNKIQIETGYILIPNRIGFSGLILLDKSVPNNYTFLVSEGGITNSYALFPVRVKAPVWKLKKNLILKLSTGISFAFKRPSSLLKSTTGIYSKSITPLMNGTEIIETINGPLIFQSNQFLIAELGSEISWQFSKHCGISLFAKQMWGLSGKVRQASVDITTNQNSDIHHVDVTSYSDSFSIGLKVNYSFRFHKRYANWEKEN